MGQGTEETQAGIGRNRGTLFCVVGPAGSGKTTIVEEALKGMQEPPRRSLSVTTRAPRPGEVDGESYFFVSIEEFERRIGEESFFEWEKIHGNFYGTPRRPLDHGLSKGEDAVLVIDIHGAQNVKHYYQDRAVVVFVTPSERSELEQRIRKRSNASPEEIATRLKTADTEYGVLLQEYENTRAGRSPCIDYVLINDTVEHAVKDLMQIITVHRMRFEHLTDKEIKRWL